jgi:hypothetical protein
MTRTAPHPVSLVIDPAPAPRWAMALVWDLSARAGAALAGATQPDHPVAIELAVEPTEDPDIATIRLSTIGRAGDRVEIRSLVGMPARWCREASFDHVDIEGVVSCTFRASDPPEPVYARCPLLGAIGIPAGSYSLRVARD